MERQRFEKNQWLLTTTVAAGKIKSRFFAAVTKLQFQLYIVSTARLPDPDLAQGSKIH